MTAVSNATFPLVKKNITTRTHRSHLWKYTDTAVKSKILFITKDNLFLFLAKSLHFTPTHEVASWSCRADEILTETDADTVIAEQNRKSRSCVCMGETTAAQA